MRIEINAGGLGGSIAISEFQSDISKFISNVDSVISSFKTVKNEIYDINGGTTNLQEALDNIETRINLEEEKKESAQKVQRKAENFLDLVVRIDKQVAEDVNKNKEAFYKTNPWLRPPTSVDPNKVWYEQAWDWLCGTAEEIAKDVKAAWADSTLKKIWDGLVEFYEKYKFEIINWTVTVLCAIASIVVIALVPGASILFIAAVSAASSAIVAATRSITTQYQQSGSWDGIDWGTVFKDTFIAAVVGGITGAIGAGVGGAITNSLTNTGLGATLLSSSSTAVRVTTGAIIGGTSEVLSGMVTRGAAEATESFLETGTVGFDDVWDAAVDPQQMLIDATIGGATGGFSAGKNQMQINRTEENKFGNIDNTNTRTFDDGVTIVQDKLNSERYYSKGNQYDEFADFWENGMKGYEYVKVDNPPILHIDANEIEGVWLSEYEISNPSSFWDKRYSKTEYMDYVKSGMLDNNPIEVTRVNDSFYYFNGEGRHRILAAQELNIDIPVKIVGFFTK